MGYIYQNATALRYAGMIVTAIALVVAFASHNVSRTFTDRQFYTARYAAAMTSGIGTAQDAQIGRDYMSLSCRSLKVFGAVETSEQDLVVSLSSLNNLQVRNESVTQS